jgi:hypothetical protein
MLGTRSVSLWNFGELHWAWRYWYGSDGVASRKSRRHERTDECNPAGSNGSWILCWFSIQSICSS